MIEVDEYRHRAKECERLAAQVLSEDQRQAILKIAAAWRELANQREQSLKSGAEPGSA
jgi:hypothetical protein